MMDLVSKDRESRFVVDISYQHNGFSSVTVETNFARLVMLFNKDPRVMIHMLKSFLVDLLDDDVGKLLIAWEKISRASEGRG
jgi:hypothetical protein